MLFCHVASQMKSSVKFSFFQADPSPGSGYLGVQLHYFFFFFFLIHIHLVGIFFQKASPECETACLELAISSLSCAIISLTTSYLTGNLGDPLNAQKLLTSPGPLQRPTCSFLAPGACSKGVSHCQGQDCAQEHAWG